MSAIAGELLVSSTVTVQVLVPVMDNLIEIAVRRLTFVPQCKPA
jgi:hypothetical protein